MDLLKMFNLDGKGPFKLIHAVGENSSNMFYFIILT